MKNYVTVLRGHEEAAEARIAGYDVHVERTGDQHTLIVAYCNQQLGTPSASAMAAFGALAVAGDLACLGYPNLPSPQYTDTPEVPYLDDVIGTMG